MAIIKKYPVKVVRIYSNIDSVYTVEFESLDKPFKYEPGQFLHIALDEYDPAGQWPDSRCYSIQTSPGEEMIRITFAVKGNFTRRMRDELKPGKLVTLKLPYGDLFSQSHIKSNTVFIAGGTGITPFLSLFTYPSFASYLNPVLFAGFRNKEMNLYNEQISIARGINPGLEVHYVYQDLEGPLNIETIFKMSKKNTSFFISGPPLMINTFKLYLLKTGMSAEQIITDDWE